MDAYIEQILAEMPDSTLNDVVKNILDEPIPEAVKGRLLKPLQPRKYRPFPPPRRAKERKRKAIEEEFDPIPRHKVLRSVKDYQDEILTCLQRTRRTNSPSGRHHGRSEISYVVGRWMCRKGIHRALTPGLSLWM